MFHRLMSRRSRSYRSRCSGPVILALMLILPLAGCRLGESLGLTSGNRLHTEGEEIMPERTDDDQWAYVGQAGRGNRPSTTKKPASMFERWFSQYQDPRAAQIDRNLGYD